MPSGLDRRFSLLRRLRRAFLELLYRQLAFLYDPVAALVSWGYWNDWVRQVIPYLEGQQVLELGHGPGHLQQALLERAQGSAMGSSPRIVGLDVSPQMSRLAWRRLVRAGHRPHLVRARAQALPFPASSFDTVVATFPSDYFLDPQTLIEAIRVLRYRGRLVVLLMAWPKHPFLNWFYRATGQISSSTGEQLREEVHNALADVFPKRETLLLETDSASLLIWIIVKQA